MAEGVRQTLRVESKVATDEDVPRARQRGDLGREGLVHSKTWLCIATAIAFWAAIRKP